MTRLPLLLIVAMSLVACVPRKRPIVVEPEPAWKTTDGKQEIWGAFARTMLDNGQPRKALEFIRKIRESGENGPEVDLLQGEAHHQEGLLREAEDHFNRAAERMRRDPRPYRELGLLYADTQRVDQAIDAFQRAVELGPEDAATWNNLGFLQFSKHQGTEAVTSLEKAVSLDGTNGRYRMNLAFAYFETGDVDDALQALQTAAPPAEASYNLGLLWELKGDTDEALKLFQQTLRLQPAHRLAKEAIVRINLSLVEEAP